MTYDCNYCYLSTAVNMIMLKYVNNLKNEAFLMLLISRMDSQMVCSICSDLYSVGPEMIDQNMSMLFMYMGVQFIFYPTLFVVLYYYL